MAFAALLVLSYLVGAFPSSVVLGRLLRGIDIRERGSRNAGGTNAWRVLGWKIGLPVMILDAAKGAIAAGLIARLPLGSLPLDLGLVSLLCGLAAVVGHVFPVYTRFKGGKGVATAGGMLLTVASWPAVSAAMVFAATIILFGRVSLGSILGAISLPISIFLLNHYTALDYPFALIILTSVLAVFIVITHRANIRRLLRREERAFPQLQLWRRLLRTRH